MMNWTRMPPPVVRLFACLVLLAVPSIAHAVTWDTFRPIECDGIDQPGNGSTHMVEAEVTCEVDMPLDDDSHGTDDFTAKAPNPPPLPQDQNAFTWTCTAGSFKNGEDNDRIVTWIAPTTPTKDITISVKVKDDAVIPEGDDGTRDDVAKDGQAMYTYEVTAHACKADLDIGDVPDADEITVGAFIALNDDDDNSNDTADKDETGTVTGEDDLVAITLDCGPKDLQWGWVELKATSGWNKIKLWTDQTKTEEVTLHPTSHNITWYLPEDPEDPVPTTLWVEGYAASSGVRDVTLTLTYGYDREPVCYDTVNITVFDFTISKCDSSWVPVLTGDNDTDITATITPSDLTSTIKFTLQSVSDEPGYCLNAGAQTTTDKDLNFENQEGFTISGSDNEYAETTSAVNSAQVSVTSYDYGAYGQIKAEATIGGAPRVANIAGTFQEFARVPRDDDDNKIADSASQNHDSTLLDGAINATVTTITVDATAGAPTSAAEGTRAIRIDDEQITYTEVTATTFTGCTRGANETAAASHADNATVKWWHNDQDAETDPAGDGTNGDGLSRYEEYRGFVVAGDYERTDPAKKDYFVQDLSGFGDLGSFPGDGMPECHRLTGGEVDNSQGTVGRINFNGETAHNGNVFAAMMTA